MRLSMDDYCAKQWEQVNEYVEGVKDGTIITNRYVKLAVQRWEEDNKRDDIEVKTKMIDKVFKFFSILNAEIYGEIKQFHLFPFQSFFLASLFGPYKKGTRERKYKEAFFYMSRKNGKTTLAAAIQAYFLVMDGDVFPQSILIAYTKEQSNRALESLQGMIIQTPDLAKLLKFNRGQVYIGDGKSQGFCQTVASKEASLQGYKLTSCILDEIHTYSDHKLYSAAKKGMSTKLNPMLLMISTAGDESKTFCKDRVSYAQRVLRGDIKDDSSYALLYMLDEEDLSRWNNEECWYKSNPGLGTIKKLSYMRDELVQAKHFPASRYDFLTYDLNMYTDSITKWIMAEYLKPQIKHLEIDKYIDREVYVGADFSEVKDLSSIALLFPNKDEQTFDVFIYYIFPKVDDKLQRKGNINLKYWIDEGYIKQCQKPIIDDEEILDLLKGVSEKYDICGFGYDRRAASKIAENIKQFIEALVVKPIQQGFGLSSSIKTVQALIETKKLNIMDNPVTEWNFNNVVIGHDDFGNWKLNKNKSLDSIDGVVALINAYKIYETMNYGSVDYFGDIVSETKDEQN